MKKVILSLCTLIIFCAQPLLAGSIHEGGEKQKQKETGIPVGRPSLDMERPSADQMQATSPAEAMPDAQVSIQFTPKAAPSTPVEQEKVRVVTPEKVKKAAPHKPTKVHREKKTHGGSLFGLLSFIFGIIGFVFGWFLWPLGLTFAVLAIIFGIIGLAGEYGGSTLALVGLILGILTIVLPIFVFWALVGMA